MGQIEIDAVNTFTRVDHIYIQKFKDEIYGSEYLCSV